MQTKIIKKCRLCGCNDLIEVFDFGVQALSTRFPGPRDPDAESVPLKLVQCTKKECGLTQLMHDYDCDDLYRRGYGYRSGVNNTMKNHLKQIVDQASALAKVQKGDVVLDIASNDGTLLHCYDDSLIRVGIDPTIRQYKDYYSKDITTSDNFFSRSEFIRISPKNNKVKVITSIAVFYDIPDPVGFVLDIAAILEDNGIWILEQSYLPLLLNDLSFDSICHEHLAYYGLKQLKLAADIAGLRIFNIETNSMNGGSIRAFLCHKESNFKTNNQNIKSVEDLEEQAKINDPNTFIEFKEKIMAIGNELTEFLKKEKVKGKKIHIYGASTKGNILLQLFNIDSKIIDVAAERNEWKLGHRTPGTNIRIISEKESRNMHPDYYLVLPWHFKEEFIKRESEFINNGGKLIFPLPKLEIYPT